MADRKLTDLELERHLAGDLPEARFAEATDADRARVGELRAEAEAFLRSVDVDMEVKRIHQRVERMKPEARDRRAWLRWLVPASALAAAAAVILVVFRRGGDGPTPGGPGDDIQVKGDEISLVVYRATPGAGSTRLASGDPVHAGDRLRFEINAGKPGFVAIVGIDGSGTPTVYHPSGGDAPVAFDPTARLLPGAIALDATPGDERFFAIYAERPFELSTIMTALASKAPLPPHISKAEVVLPKLTQ